MENIEKDITRCSQALGFDSYKITHLLKLFSDLDKKDKRTSEHCICVARIMRQASELSCSLGLDPSIMELGGIYHDIGKLRAPASVLRKERGFDGLDMAVIRNHPINGWKLLEGTNYFLMGLAERHHTLQDEPYPSTYYLHDIHRILSIHGREENAKAFDRMLVMLVLSDHTEAAHRNTGFIWKDMAVTKGNVSEYLSTRFPKYAGIIEQFHSAGIF